MYGAPPVGACFDLTLRQAAARSNPEPPVDCARRHTLLVTDVAVLPDRLSWSSSDAALERAVDRVARRVCPHHVSSTTWLRSFWDVPGKRFVVACYSRTRR